MPNEIKPSSSSLADAIRQRFAEAEDADVHLPRRDSIPTPPRPVGESTANPLQQSLAPVVALHRYFIWADRFRFLFKQALATQGDFTEVDARRFFIDDRGLYLSYWYAALFVVIEGYLELKLSDDRVDALLALEDNVRLLRRYRNGMCHFQAAYHDARFLDLIGSGSAIVEWVYVVHSELGRLLLDETRKLNSTEGTD